MWQAGIAAFLTAGMIGSIVVLQAEGAFPQQQIQRLEPNVVGTLVLDDAPREALFTVGNMAPGDVAVRALRVTDRGTLALRYALRTETQDATAGLDRAVQLTVRAPVGGACAPGAGDVIAGPFSLAAAAFGSPELGAQPGDRLLQPQASEVLCFDAALPLDATNAVAGASATVTLIFHAEEARVR